MSTTGTEPTTAADPVRLPPTLRLGAVDLVVPDVDRAVAWYTRALGLRAHRHDATEAELGDGVETVVVLHEDPTARPPGRHAGLYHYALLYPSREELARAALRIMATRTPITGASDHGTHEAIYLPDIDGNGIELAADRPRERWPEDLGYAGGPAALDVDGLLAAIDGEEPPAQVREGLRMGHLHLHVGDIDEGLAFYRDVLGFEVRANLGSAAFVSAGGYHHHLGFNVWRGRGVGPPPDRTIGLRHWTVQLPAGADVDAVRARVREAGLGADDHPGGVLLRDPWGTAMAVVSTTATGLRSTASVATDRPSPYLLQVAKHFRHKLEVRFDERRATIALPAGVAELRAGDGVLELGAAAHTPADLRRVEEVVGGHLERFGGRDDLQVAWERRPRG